MIIDWATCKVLAWRLAKSLDARFCIEALEKALGTHEAPEIVNAGPGGQFTRAGRITMLSKACVRTFMVGRGRCIENILTKCLWRSLKHEAAYLVELTDGFHAGRVIDGWMGFHNAKRPIPPLAAPRAMRHTSHRSMSDWRHHHQI